MTQVMKYLTNAEVNICQSWKHRDHKMAFIQELEEIGGLFLMVSEWTAAKENRERC